MLIWDEKGDKKRRKCTVSSFLRKSNKTRIEKGSEQQERDSARCGAEQGRKKEKEKKERKHPKKEMKQKSHQTGTMVCPMLLLVKSLE